MTNAAVADIVITVMLPRKRIPTIPMPAADTVTIRLPDALAEAAREWCEANGLTLSEIIRESIARRIGKPELAETRGVGKPKSA